MSLLGILELKKDTDVMISSLGSILCLPILCSLSLFFYFSPHDSVTASAPVSLPWSVSLPALASTDSSPVTPVDTSAPSASMLTKDFRYFYIHRQKVPASGPVPTNPLQ